MVETTKVANWACNASSRSGGGGFPYGRVGVNVSSSGSSSSCSSAQNNYALSREAKEAIRTVSKELVNAWERYMSRIGSYASILFRDDAHYFTIILQTHGLQNNKGQAQIISQGTFSCGNKSKNELSTGLTYTNGITISCTRSNIAQAIAIDVNYLDGYPGQSLYIPAVSPPPAVPPSEPKVISVQVPPIVQMVLPGPAMRTGGKQIFR